MGKPPVVMERMMTPMQWIAGSSVIAAATVCGLISSEIVNSNIPVERTVASPNQNEHIPVKRAVATQNENVGKGICFTLDGKQFEWNFANVPFGILRCSK
jgi:hypothetical protein